jgi:hypothetical protein
MSRRTTRVYLPALLLLAAALMACAAVVLAVSREAKATFPGPNGKIAYAVLNSGIYTINPGGGGKSKVTDTRVSGDAKPSYSPNGKRIAYEGYKGLGSDDDEDFDSEIYTIKVGGGGKTKVTDTVGYAMDPSWGSRP